MKSNKKKFIVFMTLMVFVSLLTIKVAYAEKGSAGQSSGGPAAGCTKGWCWHDMEAIRISFYHKDGNKIGKSLNFYNSNQSIVGETYDFRYNRYLDTSFYTPGLNGSKYDYIDKNTALVDYSQWPSFSFRSIFTGGIPFEKNLYETGQAMNVFNEKLGLGDPAAIKSKIIDAGYENNFELGISLQRIISSRDYYMIVEPITILKNSNGRLYIGTYYELQQIYNKVTDQNFGGAKSLFRTGWGDPKLAMSIYLSSGSSIGGSGHVKDVLDSIKSETSFTNVRNGYGIGVVWFGNKESICNEYSNDWNSTTGTCEPTPPSQNVETCKVLDPIVDPCNDRIVYEYQNCSTSGYSKVEYSGYTICDIQCNEKYYVATWPTVNNFNPISGTGILAGSYFQGIGPTVYHKKTCNYVMDEVKLKEVVDYKIKTTCKRTRTVSYSCGVSNSEICYRPETYIDQNCSDEINAEAYIGENSIQGKCTMLKNNYDNMDSEIDAKKDVNDQREVPLNTTFSDYKLTSTLIKTEYNLDGFKYGYKNTFDYVLLGNINRYIGMNSIYGIENIDAEAYYDNGRAMLTTPILTKSGDYNYILDYRNIFSDEFKNIIKNYSNNKYNIDRDLEKTSCPYKVTGRNIKNSCIPTSKNNYCSNPDKSFPIPKIKMVYRPINLNHPFPGKDGNGRIPGPNWNIEAVTQYIENNRYVHTEEVYNKEALYVIRLDANNIKKIRDYNKEHPYDDFTLSCTEGKGTECISNFLRDNNLIESGTCASINSDNFYSCAEK